jgi:hypothetical protein
VNETFFTDHFPDKVVAVLSELALMSWSIRPYYFH